MLKRLEGRTPLLAGRVVSRDGRHADVSGPSVMDVTTHRWSLRTFSQARVVIVSGGRQRHGTRQGAEFRSFPVRALAGAGPGAGGTAAGAAAGLPGRPYPKRPDLAVSEILAGSTPGFASWLTGSQEADLRLITQTPERRVPAAIVRRYGALYYK